MPHIKSNLKPFPFFIDVENGKAVVPGTGQDKFTVTYSEDLARMIVRLLDAEDKWPPVAFLSGSDISLNEVIASVEKARGTYPECLTLQLFLTWSCRLQDRRDLRPCRKAGQGRGDTSVPLGRGQRGRV